MKSRKKLRKEKSGREAPYSGTFKLKLKNNDMKKSKIYKKVESIIKEKK